MKLGFIGAGSMGSAVLTGILNKNAVPVQEIAISRKHPEKNEKWSAKGIQLLGSNQMLAEQAECVVLAIKPYQMDSVLEEIHDALKGKFVISIVAGWTYEMLLKALPKSARFVRVMPNTPLAVGEGMSLLSDRYTCTEEEFAFAKMLFDAGGKTLVVEDRVFIGANGICGCGPAFCYAFIEALADGGVRCGVPRNMAYQLAAQTLIGAGKMVLETGEHPGKLKDAVCSPGGTTIEGMFALEKGGMRAAVIDAVGATAEKTLKMIKE